MTKTFETISSLKTSYANQIAGIRLLLPTIQRGLVWDNQRIVDYWDSLNRGWFPGVFMVRLLQPDEFAYDVSGSTTVQVKAVSGDREIFDGQQRMTAIMLGYGLGRFSRSHKVWVGFIKSENPDTQRIRFRITTIGQPFGYKLDKPNEKFSTHLRRARFADFIDAKNLHNPTNISQLELNENVFRSNNGNYLLGDDQYNWFPLADILNSETRKDNDKFAEFRERIQSTQVLVHTVTASEFSDYEEFFRRIGQGGVRLTDDELTYALMNNQFPALRPLVEQMLDNPMIGRLSSPTDLALGLFRLARVTVSNIDDYPKLQEWERANRPNPEFIRRAGTVHSVDSDQNKALVSIKDAFENWISKPDELSSFPVGLMKDVRTLLQNIDGKVASPILLSRMDRFVIDIAMMLCSHKVFADTSAKIRSAFCYWTMFFAESEKVAYQLAVALSTSTDSDCQIEGYGETLLKKIVEVIDDKKHSMSVPTPEDLTLIRNQIRGSDNLIPPSKWFTAADEENERRPSDYFMHLYFWSPRGKNLMLWIQSEYLNEHYPNFDPTSDRDEFLPVDLDHIIASARFGFRWTKSWETIWNEKINNHDEFLIFRDKRTLWGNLIGNLRWLDATQNRSRGSGGGEGDITIDEDTVCKDYIDRFCELSVKLNKNDLSGWDDADLRNWQCIVLLRTVDLVESSLNDWGIPDLFN